LVSRASLEPSLFSLSLTHNLRLSGGSELLDQLTLRALTNVSPGRRRPRGFFKRPKSYYPDRAALTAAPVLRAPAATLFTGSLNGSVRRLACAGRSSQTRVAGAISRK